MTLAGFDVLLGKNLTPEQRAFAERVIERFRAGGDGVDLNNLHPGDPVARGPNETPYLIVSEGVCEHVANRKLARFKPRELKRVNLVSLDFALDDRFRAERSAAFDAAYMAAASARRATTEAKKSSERAAKVAAEALGTCQGCLRDSSLLKKRVARHGWVEEGRRVGYYGLGHQRGECEGSRALPLDVNADISRGVVRRLLAEIPMVEEEIATLHGSPPLTVARYPSIYGGDPVERSSRADLPDERGRLRRFYILRAERDGSDYRNQHAMLLHKATSHLRLLRADLATMRAAIVAHGHAL
jgi:hypothetical protein